MTKTVIKISEIILLNIKIYRHTCRDRENKLRESNAGGVCVLTREKNIMCTCMESGGHKDKTPRPFLRDVDTFNRWK